MINPNDVTTVRVGQLPPNPLSMSSILPHEVSSSLKRITMQEVADFIADYIGTASSLAFNPTTVSDGGTLPSTTSNEWMLVGKGTFQNVGGGLPITTTEELNALTSNGSTWSLSVEIPISPDVIGIVQTIRSGFTGTAPSENAVFDALATKLETGGYTGTAQDIVDLINTFATVPAKLERFGDGVSNVINIGTSALVKLILLEGAPLIGGDWSQSGSDITFITFTPELGKRLQFI